MATHNQKLDWWGRKCASTSQLTGVEFLGRYPVRVQHELVPAVKALEKVFLDSGYSPIPTGPTGSYVCRNIGGTNTLSLHALGIAIDIDYGNNPHLRTAIPRGFGVDPRFNITEAQVEAVERIVNEDGTPIWKWLGWTIGDTMHFEIDVPPGKTTPKEAGMKLNEYRTEHNVEDPPPWAVSRWAAYVAAGGSTVPESIGWPYSRFDIADFWAKFVQPLERRISELEAMHVHTDDD